MEKPADWHGFTEHVEALHRQIAGTAPFHPPWKDCGTSTPWIAVSLTRGSRANLMYSREVAEHETASQNVRFTPKSGHLQCRN
jgi:hypothetical protein